MQHKSQNRNRDLIKSIRKIQKHGMEVQAGFILGFDKDPESIFHEITAFIQESGIVTAMVGLLNAPKDTKLYKRLASEGRMLKNFTGDNTDFSMNFVPCT
jgi:biotin synthase-like enzyme